MMSEGVQSPSAASSTIRSYLARSSRTVQCLLGVDKPGLLAGRLAGSQELLAIIAEFGTANKLVVVRVSRARGMYDAFTRHMSDLCLSMHTEFSMAPDWAHYGIDTCEPGVAHCGQVTLVEGRWPSVDGEC